MYGRDSYTPYTLYEWGIPYIYGRASLTNDRYVFKPANFQILPETGKYSTDVVVFPPCMTRTIDSKNTCFRTFCFQVWDVDQFQHSFSSSIFISSILRSFRTLSRRAINMVRTASHRRRPVVLFSKLRKIFVCYVNPKYIFLLHT